VIAKNVNGSFYDFEAYYCKQRTMDCIYQSEDAWGEKAIIDWAQGIVLKGEFDNKAEQLLSVAKVIDQIYETSNW